MWCNTFHFSKPVDFTAQKLCNMTLSCWLTELLLSNLKVMEMLDCEYSRCKKAANNIIFFYQNEKNNYFSVINNNTSVCIYRVIQLWLLSTLFVPYLLILKKIMSWLEYLHIKSFQFWCIHLCKPPSHYSFVRSGEPATTYPVLCNSEAPASSLENTRNVWGNYQKPSSG